MQTRIVTGRMLLFAAVVVSGLSLSPSARAQATIPYNGGPTLSSVEIHPLYFGSSWGPNTDAFKIVEQQRTLKDIADYISAKNVPSNLKTTIAQYGITSANVAAPILVQATPQTLDDAAIRQIIANAIAAPPPNNLPNFGANILIMVFPGPGFPVNCGGCAGYHSEEALNKYYGVVGADNVASSGFPAGAIIAHEVFEAATDPALHISPAFLQLSTGKEVSDGPCQASVMPTDLPYYNGTPMANLFDKTLGGNCNVSPYDPPTTFDPIAFLFPAILSP